MQSFPCGIGDLGNRAPRREIHHRKIRLDFNDGRPAASLSAYPVSVEPRRDPPHTIPFSNVQIYLVIQRVRHAAGVEYSWWLLARRTWGPRVPRVPRVYARVDTRG